MSFYQLGALCLPVWFYTHCGSYMRTCQSVCVCVSRTHNITFVAMVTYHFRWHSTSLLAGSKGVVQNVLQRKGSNVSIDTQLVCTCTLLLQRPVYF